MSFTVIIPARFASTRLPGKPLLEIAGKPMIQHVYEQALKSKADQVVIATDDLRIQELCIKIGASVVMTSADHPSGTDRLEEVVTQLGLSEEHIVVNVQGDEPLIPPEIINQVAQNLADNTRAGIATLCERIHDPKHIFNPNVVKVVFDDYGLASYFSRAPIPWARDSFTDMNTSSIPLGAEYFRHIGMYAYRVEFLKNYVTWLPSMTEKTESLEQLRAISNGVKIHIEEALISPPAGVDTEEDLVRLRKLMSV
jgi:3-deoxy-manno-octulosonate cytidylyltransferase (CMP-KDO synthetase)